MLDELKKSISSSLYERVASPLYGTLLVSWLAWNWKIVYLTFFISEKNLDKDKITYIVENFSNIHNLVTLPLVSTLFLLTLAPFLTNGAFWLHLNFNKWKVDKKHEIEKEQLLTLEQSIELRAEIANSEKQFETMLSGKNSEIESLKFQLQEAKNDSTPVKPAPRKSSKPKSSESASEKEFRAFLDSEKLDSFIKHKDEFLKDGWFSHDEIEGFENAMAFGLVQHQGTGAKLSSKGKEFFKWLILNQA